MSAGVISPKLILSGVGPHLSSTQGGLRRGQVVNPTGGLTPARPDGAEQRGFHLQGAVRHTEHSYGTRTLVRIQLWWWRGREVAGVVPATSSSAAEAQVQVGMGLRCANKRGKVLRRLCAMRGARWAHARDQMVTGASPATSAGGGACGWMWCGSYSV